MEKIMPKRVSNYELFYDLVFVLAMRRLSSYLHTPHFHLGSFLVFLGSTSLVLSIWFYQTVYLNKYGERDRLDVLLNIPAMFIIGNFALMLGLGLDEFGPREFLLYNSSMILAHLLILLQYYLRGKKIGFNHDIAASMKLLSMVIGYFVILVICGYVFRLYRFENHLFALFWMVPYLFPLLYKGYNDIDRINFPHLVERCQLLTILTFGETVIGVIQAYPVYETPVLGIVFFAGISFMFVAYISQTHLTIEHHQRVSGSAMLYGHLFIILGVSLTTVGMELLADHHHASYGLMLLSLGLVLYYVSLYSTSIYNKALYRFSISHYLVSAILLGLGLIAMWLVRDYEVLLALVFALLCWEIPQQRYRARQKAQQTI
ncbi:low temperature requirement protein A [Streptococcus sp. zg-JUN1979]|uniref:low temperature requirement protein A n=1 Tax=Streptococcus sp. zg-JUN1979 TaxID=3391450 RepID=UPI0039A690CC